MIFAPNCVFAVTRTVKGIFASHSIWLMRLGGATGRELFPVGPWRSHGSGVGLSDPLRSYEIPRDPVEVWLRGEEKGLDLSVMGHLGHSRGS